MFLYHQRNLPFQSSFVNIDYNLIKDTIKRTFPLPEQKLHGVATLSPYCLHAP